MTDLSGRACLTGGGRSCHSSDSKTASAARLWSPSKPECQSLRRSLPTRWKSFAMFASVRHPGKISATADSLDIFRGVPKCLTHRKDFHGYRTHGNVSTWSARRKIVFWLPRPGQMSPLQPRRQHLFVRGAGSTRAGGRTGLTYAGMRWSCGNVFWVKHASYI